MQSSLLQKSSINSKVHYSILSQFTTYFKEHIKLKQIDKIRQLYNASGVHPTTDPDNPKSQFTIDRYAKHLCKLIQPNMRALDLGCNAGRCTFAMEDMGAIATGIDCAENPIRHAKKVAEKRKSQCQFNVGDIGFLPYRENSFDLALLPSNIVEISCQTLENLTVQLKQILSNNGLFVIFMHDEFIKRIGETDFLDRYDAPSGSVGGHNTIPGKGMFNYPTYFWTVVFAKYIIEKHLFCQHVEQIEENMFILVFCNKKGTTPYSNTHTDSTNEKVTK